MARTDSRTPSRLHHNAFVVKDQGATRQFYEQLLGLPLVATWTEVDELFGTERSYCHTFYGLADGSALAFFQFADNGDYKRFGPKSRPSPFIHIALNVDGTTQVDARRRLDAAGWPNHTVEHGYCSSLYVTDPDGLLIELTRDHADVEHIAAERLRTAAADLERWMSGDHASNNTYRGTDG
jgi:glyoxylase I family protein